MLEQLPVDLLGQVDVFLTLLVDVETVDEELDGAALEEHGEHDDGLEYSNDWLQETIEAHTSVVVMNIWAAGTSFWLIMETSEKPTAPRSPP